MVITIHNDIVNALCIPTFNLILHNRCAKIKLNKIRTNIRKSSNR